MRGRAFTVAAGCAALIGLTVAHTDGQGQQGQTQQGQPQGQAAQGQGRGRGQAEPSPEELMVRELVSRLTLDRYKGTVKGLTQFGDRREGTQRNRDAVNWIESQLKSYGCQTARMEYDPRNPRGLSEEELAARGRGAGRGGGGQGQQGRAGGQGQAQAGQTGRGGQQAGQPAQQGRGGQGRAAGPAATVLEEPRRNQAGGSTYYGITRRAGVNNTAEAQPDEKLRELNSGPVIPGPVPQVYCTKVGATRPNEMYILGAHMDGIGWGEAANDDGSGTALVMELARVFNSPDVVTDVSIRFALWNGEEGGLRGANAYVAQRQALQGKKDEPKWLGMIQHDMMMWDHGMPRADGTLSPEQRPEADFNIEWQSNSKMAEQSMKLALVVKLAADKFTTDYPGMLGPHMTNTDSTPFMDIVPAISLRENERGMHTGAGWNPHWHQPTDLYSTFSDKDYKLGMNAAQATLSAIAQLTGAKITKK
jgi:hypothetical protein